MRNFFYKAGYFLLKWCDDLNPIVIIFLIMLSATLNYYLGLWANGVLIILLWFVKKELCYTVLALSLLLGALNGGNI